MIIFAPDILCQKRNMKRNLSIICTALLMTLGSAAMAQLPSAQEIAPKMYPGWNLGNTLEACPCNWLSNDLDWETGWQSAKTTQQIIDYVASQGFKSVRIPVAWVTGHLDNESTAHIKPQWMARVREIVDYCINDGLYVVLNDHWDGGWLENNVKTYDTTRAEKLKTIWTQIAEEFKDYDEHLLFAGLNEPNAEDKNAMQSLFRYEQDFVDAVRATGGNNLTRTLVVQGPNTSIDLSCEHYTQMPTDPTSGRMMMEVHYYSPYNFCMMTKDESWGNQAYFWGAENHVTSAAYKKWNATWGEEQYVIDQMQLMYNHFGSKGIPVIIGEYGAIWRTIDASVQDKHDASIRLYHKTVNQQAINHGCIPFVWDTNGRGKNSMDVLNRNTLSVFNPHALEGIKAGVEASTWPASMSIEPTDATSEKHATYNLQGIPVGADTKGIVIQQGRVCLKN